jgi:hypothetical protein
MPRRIIDILRGYFRPKKKPTRVHEVFSAKKGEKPPASMGIKRGGEFLRGRLPPPPPFTFQRPIPRSEEKPPEDIEKRVLAPPGQIGQPPEPPPSKKTEIVEAPPSKPEGVALKPAEGPFAPQVEEEVQEHELPIAEKVIEEKPLVAYSGPCRTLIPADSGHLFRSIPAGHSD